MKLIMKALNSLLARLERAVKNNLALVEKAQTTADEAVAELEAISEQVEEVHYIATSAEFHAEESAKEARNVALSKLNVSDPKGTGAFSLNRKEDSTVGSHSVATGYNCTASGNYSYAHGLDCEATGNYSHAEGRMSVASGLYSHAENLGCTAKIAACHAEGWYTVASGNYAHSEGEYTQAVKANTHAEGKYTVANTECQHVQGRYNVVDTEKKYAHIVGNGKVGVDENGQAIDLRSNAHTLDWDGNAWFAGTVEGTALILSSPGGKRFKVTVDDTGTLSTTEVTE